MDNPIKALGKISQESQEFNTGFNLIIYPIPVLYPDHDADSVTGFAGFGDTHTRRDTETHRQTNKSRTSPNSFLV